MNETDSKNTFSIFRIFSLKLFKYNERAVNHQLKVLKTYYTSVLIVPICSGVFAKGVPNLAPLPTRKQKKVKMF